MLQQTAKIKQRIRASHRRQGAILSVEWLVVFPILVALMFAIFEFSLLWSARNLLEAATYAAAREASLPAVDEPTRYAAAVAAAEAILDPRFIDVPSGTADAGTGYTVDEFTVGTYTGDPITVTLSLPMTTAAPDLLEVVGISIEGQRLTATTVVRME